MKTIYLIRHGEKVRESGDVRLTEIGRSQAKFTGRFLSQFNIDKILSSPSTRAKETAKIISKINNLSFSIRSRLKERINFGDIPIQSYYDYMRLCDLSSLNRDFVLPNGESSISCGKRLELVINSLQKSSFKHIVIVAHQGIFADYIRNVFSDNEIIDVYPKFFSKREQSFSNCSITTIDLKNNKTKLLKLGFNSHLSKLIS
ncbi:histidine phosphatase family protein [Patescibacteria group bacterium]|nr:histidine phosphatase family protein [Patescibacteria group bacterium]